MFDIASNKMQLTYFTFPSSKQNSENENQSSVITKKILNLSAVNRAEQQTETLAETSDSTYKKNSPLTSSKQGIILKTSRSGSPLNTSRSGSPLNTSRSGSPLIASRSGSPWTTSKTVIELDQQIICKIYQSKLLEMKNNHLEAIKISRYDHSQLKNTYIILKNGTILRGFHGADKKGNRILDKNEGLIGEGGLKIVNKLYNSHGKTSHVIAKILDPSRTDIIATNIEIAKEFQSTPHLLIGSYLEWKNKKGELKQGFISPCMDTDLLKLNGLPEHFTLLEGVAFFLHIAEGVKAMHDKNWVHLDIKPENILLKKLVCYLTDFDCAFHLKKDTPLPFNGTLAFMAPEIFSRTSIGIEIGKKADIYSLGITFLQIGHTLREHQDKHMGLDEDDIELNANLSQLANTMCDEDPHVRPTIDDIIKRLKQLC